MSNRTISEEYFNKLTEASSVLCGYCENDECERCIVTSLMDSAYIEFENEYENDDE